MFPPFPSEAARPHALALLSRPELRDKMAGALVCRDSGGREVVLRAFSGQLDGKWLAEGFVPPPLDAQKYDEAVAKNDLEIHQLTDEILALEGEWKRLSAEQSEILATMPKTATRKNPAVLIQHKILELKEKRRRLSIESLNSIYSLFEFHCADGSVKNFRQIFGMSLPPTGTGECCAPKLLNFAFANGLQPVSLYECREDGIFVPPCDEKCRPLLRQMLGLEILYRDQWIAAVDKPSGLLSVPGRGEKKQDCVASRLRRLFPDCIEQPAAHRLDMDTSGVMLLAFTAEAHRNLSAQFEASLVQKEYVALLEGSLSRIQPELFERKAGRIELKFRLDVENRPHQIYDAANGKLGVTDWEFLGEEEFCGRAATRILFRPRTGRTHQLRLHSASPLGLNMPIIGDNLYGTPHEGERLMLHARKIRFRHPISNQVMEIGCEVPF